MDEGAQATHADGVVAASEESKRLAHSTKIRVVSAKVPLSERFVDIWRSRELLGKLISTEIKVKYKNSALGILWSMVAPAVTLVLYWVVFGQVLKSAIPNFVIYLFSGMLLWNFFQTSLQTATGVIVDRAAIVKKVSFPREILVLSSVGTAAVYLFFQTIVLVLFMAILQYAPDWKLLPLLLVALVAEFIFATAVSLILSSLNVYLRDVRHLIDIFLTVWFFACPVVYSFWLSIYPHLSRHALSWLYLMNPMAPVVLTSQRVIYAHPQVTLTSGSTVQILPTWGVGTYLWLDGCIILGGLVLLYVAMRIFRRLEGNFAEEL